MYVLIFLSLFLILCWVISIKDQQAIKLFGESVRTKRLQRHWSQEELAFKCKIDSRQIGRVERGEVNTTVSSVFAISRALEVEVADLFDFPLPQLSE